MNPEESASKAELFPLMFDDRRIEYPVKAIQPPIRAPSKRIGKLVGVIATKSRDNDFFFVRLAIPISVLEEKEIRAVCDPNATMSYRNS